MQKLNLTHKINPKFSWEDWQLYEMPGCKAAARQLNRHLKFMVNSGTVEVSKIKSEMMRLMSSLGKFGCSDTEPRNFLYDILDEIYKD